jgi:hypothetical protein
MDPRYVVLLGTDALDNQVPVLVTPGGAIVTTGGGASSLAGLFTGGSLITYASPAGVTNNVNPTGWLTTPSAVGRINVNTAAGNAEWTGLDAAGINDGTGVLITNVGPNNLQLDNQNAGSTATNQFFASGNIVLVPGQGTIAVYSTATGFWDIR